VSPTAILIFARSASLESRFKPFGGNRKNTVSLFETLNSKVFYLAKNSGLPCFIYNETTQRGETFGERLSYAVQEVYDRGFEKVIILGNDCPQLDKKQFQIALTQLERNSLVVGPDTRGGAYLIGISKSVFKCAHFSRLSWQTNRLRNDLMHFCPAAAELKILQDVNSIADARKLISSFSFRSKIRKAFVRLFSISSLSFHFYFAPRSLSNIYRLYGLKAPPLV
jgi:hypothetical protein